MCVICGGNDSEEDLIYSSKFQLYVHPTCLEVAVLNGKFLAIAQDVREYERCPKCFKQCSQEGDDGDLIEVTGRYAYMTDYGMVDSWTEHWKCPYCGHEWEEDNGT